MSCPHEQEEIRVEGRGRIGRVDGGVFRPYGNYTHDPCPDELKKLGFEKVKGKHVYKIDRGNKKGFLKSREESDAASKNDTPA